MVGSDTTTTSISSFTKTICSICYEDLKPIVEDLQSISICGHVFHELCLQQWFEYCTDGKKQTCPVCKQGCTHKNVGRLYFQSIGDSVLTQRDNPKNDFRDDQESVDLLRIEVKKLEAKVSGLTTAWDFNQKEVKELSDQLQTCRQQLSKEVILKNDALKQRESLQLMLQTKSSDLVKSAMECSNLREKNLALVKELAALKVASDCNLDEEEIVKLASIYNENNSQDTIDVLKKSLVIRNKSYKELMAKCSSLGRGEARSLRKLEKAKDKIIKLQIRVQELETTIESKENEILRSLKASKDHHLNKHKTFILKATKDQSPTFIINLDDDGNDNMFEAEKKGKTDVDKLNDDGENIKQKDIANNDCLNYDKHESLKSNSIDAKAHKEQEGLRQKCGSSPPAASGFGEDTSQQSFHHNGFSSSGVCSNGMHTASKEADGLFLHDIRQIQPLSHTPSTPVPLAEPGDLCFAGGLMGPDGTSRYLGKWCKRVQNGTPRRSMLASGNYSGNLIAVGADGRGGMVKVLKSMDHSSMNLETVGSSKRFKPGGKSSSLQTQGCRQIEHFFGKVRSST